MSDSTKVPSYRRHKQSGQAIVSLPDGQGGRRDFLLGKYGTAASRAEYARVLAEWEAAGRTIPTPIVASDLVVTELIDQFWIHAKQHYRRPDGSPAHELSDFKYSLRPLKHLYGVTAAKDFGPLALKAVRQLMIDGYNHPKFGPQPALSRGVINQRINRVRRMFRWAVENELIQPAVLHGLQALKGLQKGRSEARETEPVKPVPLAFVEATLPELKPQLAAMVQLQLLTAMRSGELIVMRSIDLDTSGRIWFYRPGSDQGREGAHKTAHHGHERIVPIGPRGQEIVKRFLKTDVHAFLFDPRETMTDWRAKQRHERKTKVQPSQLNRRKRRPRCKPRDRYSVGSYARAIARACIRAKVPHWHPHQLRHSRATEIRKAAGLDAARTILSHRSPVITEIYAQQDLDKAAELMEKIG
jgi:integrase